VVTITRHGGVKRGDLITPTGRLVLYPDELGGEDWLQARRWREASDQLDWDSAKRTMSQEYFQRLGFRIGSSDVPSILDLEGVDTPAHVYRNKVYDIRAEPNESMNWGHLLEEPIALEWCRRNHAVIDEIGLVAKDDEPWRQSTIDRRVQECPVYRRDGVKEACLLEVKNVGFASASRWHREIPDRILAQLIDQLDVTGYGHAHYACLVGGNVMKQGIVWADRETELMEYVRSQVRAFRNGHLLTGIEPAWSNEKPDKMIDLDNATHPEREGVAELDLNGVGAAMAYAEIAYGAGGAGELGTAKKKAAAELRKLADGAEIATFSGERVFWYGEGHRTNVDLDQLQEGWPDAYEKCVTEKSFPVLHIDKKYKPGGEA
jgi:predicted phage-related endonuclease